MTNKELKKICNIFEDDHYHRVELYARLEKSFPELRKKIRLIWIDPKSRRPYWEYDAAKIIARIKPTD